MLAPYWAKPDERLDVHTKNLLNAAKQLYELNYITEAQYKALCRACLTHDVGKILKFFQWRVKNNGKFNDKLEVSHNILSAFFVDMDGSMPLECYLPIVYAVINHHHYENFTVVFNKKGEIVDANLALILEELKVNNNNFDDLTVEDLHDVLDDFVLEDLSKSENQEKPEFIITKGLLHKCDYASSAHIPIEFANDFTLSKLDKLVASFDGGWNDLQHFCRQNSNDNLVVVAPTGMGKTEASLLWLADHKGFYVLPLRTAINSMYSRLKTNWLGDENIDERLALLHGDSLDYYIKESEDNVSDVGDTPYFRNSLARNLSLPLTVTTPDQIFDFVFKYLGHERKLATLSYSKVIIDEIQAYSADVLCYVIYGLQMINQLGGQFAIFTATLPPFFKDLLAPNNTLV